MLMTVQLDDESLGSAIEIDYKVLDAVLSLKLSSTQLTLLKTLP
jgi:hypothetical protein